MALPDPLNPCWQRLASGALTRVKTQHLALQLMIKRMERCEDPAPTKAKEIRGFFVKWEAMLGSEIQQLANL